MPLYSCPVFVKKLCPNMIGTQCALMSMVFNRQGLKNSILGNTYLKVENNYDYKEESFMHYLPRNSIQRLEMFNDGHSFVIVFQVSTSTYVVNCAPIVPEDRISFEKIVQYLNQVKDNQMVQDTFYVNNVERSIKEISIFSQNDVLAEYNESSEVRLFISTAEYRLFWDTFRESTMKIVDLHLVDANISKISKKFKHLKYLAFLDLSGNRIHKWNWLLKYGLKTRLNSLNISRNDLKELPIQVLLLENLHALNLNGNPIDMLPKYVYFLKNLHELNIAGTKLTYLPITINRLFLMKLIYDKSSMKNDCKTIRNEINHQELIRALNSFDLYEKNEMNSILYNEFEDKFNLFCTCGRFFLNQVYCLITNKQRLIYNGQLISLEMYFCSIECASDYDKL